jgi:hypothetical protein
MAGPDLLGGTDTVLAVNSYVTNVNCRGVGYSQRIDIPEILTWIRGFMSQGSSEETSEREGPSCPLPRLRGLPCEAASRAKRCANLLERLLSAARASRADALAGR